MVKKIIKLDENTKFIEKKEIEYLAQNCTLLNKNYDLPTCYGFDPMDLNECECFSCEVTENYNEAKTNLLKLIKSQKNF